MRAHGGELIVVIACYGQWSQQCAVPVHIHVGHASYMFRKIAKIGKAYTLHARAIGSIHDNDQIMDLKS